MYSWLSGFNCHLSWLLTFFTSHKCTLFVWYSVQSQNVNINLLYCQHWEKIMNHFIPAWLSKLPWLIVLFNGSSLNAQIGKLRPSQVDFFVCIGDVSCACLQIVCYSVMSTWLYGPTFSIAICLLHHITYSNCKENCRTNVDLSISNWWNILVKCDANLFLWISGSSARPVIGLAVSCQVGGVMQNVLWGTQNLQYTFYNFANFFCLICFVFFVFLFSDSHI